MRRLRKKTAVPKAKAKVKSKAKAASQRQRRERLRAGRLLRSVANKRLTARRDALRKLNKLLTDLSLQALHLRVKALDKSNFDRVLRLLERRCMATDQKTRLREAVTEWVNNGGTLPDGVRLAADGSALETAPNEAESPSLVPQHKVLVATYELKSQAFMLTYNSNGFTPETWPDFEKHMEGLHRRLGSKAFSACLEESLHAATPVPAVKRVHTHGYLLWTDGVGYRSDSLEDFRFQGVLPRVDKCTVGANSRTPRLAALHGLWYVSVFKLGTLKAVSNFKPWMDYTPRKEWLLSLYDSHKLDHHRFLELSVQFRSLGSSKLISNHYADYGL